MPPIPKIERTPPTTSIERSPVYGTSRMSRSPLRTTPMMIA